MRSRLATATIVVLACTPFAAGAPRAQTQRPLETAHVKGNVHVIVGAGANVVVQTGRDGVLVVDTGARERRADVLAAVKALSEAPIRWIVNTSGSADHTGGNETLSQAGMTVNGNPAAIISHENTLTRMSAADRAVSELPLDTFFEAGRDFYFNGEAIFIRHLPGHTDGDVIVHFRGSDVIVAGELFTTTAYPVIDVKSGGSIDGVVEGLNAILDIAVPAWLQEGGTYVIPGRGRICDEADVLEYRDMALIVRDRIRSMVGKGASLAEVVRARPTLDYDPRYGADRGAWTTAMFVEAAYTSLSQRKDP